MEINTSTTSMPITPLHQQAIDDALQLILARVQELAPAIGYGAPPALALEQLRQSSLAKELRIIARYAEGYDLGEGDIRPTIRSVLRILYPIPMSGKGYRFPTDFQKIPLGEMIHTALTRHHPRGQRMTVGEVRALLEVTRQTVHDWAADGTLLPIYEKGILTFHRPQVEQLQRQRILRRGQPQKNAESI